MGNRLAFFVFGTEKISNVMFWYWENLYLHGSLGQGAFGLKKECKRIF